MDASNTAVIWSNLLSIKQKHDWHRAHLNHSQYAMPHQECVGKLSHYISLTKNNANRPTSEWTPGICTPSSRQETQKQSYLFFAAFTFTCCKKQQHSVPNWFRMTHVSLQMRVCLLKRGQNSIYIHIYII